MLHEFLAAHRAELIERCALKVSRRLVPEPTDAELEHGIPLFLDQLVKTLRLERVADRQRSLEISGPAGSGALPASEIGTSAARHGRELYERGFTIDQVVHDYGDLCQAITDLAFERAVPLEIDEFRTLNRCLDNAIAHAVSEFSGEQDRLASERDTRALDERLAYHAREQRKLLQTALIALRALRTGNVGLAGATGAVLERSLLALRNLVDQSLADTPAMVAMPARRELISLAELIGDVQLAASPEARARESRLVVRAAGVGLAVEGDRGMLAAALGILVHNALKSAERGSEISLTAYSSEDRVLIEVLDPAGGLVAGDGPSPLSVCRRSVEANDGVLRVRELRGTGRVFTIDLPRRSF